MIEGQDQASCPRCGSAAHVRSLGQLMADTNPSPSQAAWARAGRPVANPAPARTGRDFADGDAGGAPDLGESLVELTIFAAGYVLRRTVGRGLKRHFQEQLPAAAQKIEDYRSQRLQLAERYPDLRICLQDKVIFAAGGSKVIPLDQLSGRRLADLDAALAAAAAELRG